MKKIRLTPLAQKDLEEIYAYILKELDNKDGALNTILSIIEDYEKLSEFPFMGAKPNFDTHFPSEIRMLVSGNYNVFYRNDDEYVSVIRILYGKRDVLSTLFNLH